MPVSVTYEHDGLGCRAHVIGSVTSADLIRAKSAINTRESAERVLYQLWDTSGYLGSGFATSEIRSLAQMDAEAAALQPNIVIATVSHRDVIFGLARMWQAFASLANVKARAFRRVEEAHQWIATELRIPSFARSMPIQRGLVQDAALPVTTERLLRAP